MDDDPATPSSPPWPPSPSPGAHLARSWCARLPTRWRSSVSRPPASRSSPRPAPSAAPVPAPPDAPMTLEPAPGAAGGLRARGRGAGGPTRRRARRFPSRSWRHGDASQADVDRFLIEPPAEERAEDVQIARGSLRAALDRDGQAYGGCSAGAGAVVEDRLARLDAADGPPAGSALPVAARRGDGDQWLRPAVPPHRPPQQDALWRRHRRRAQPAGDGRWPRHRGACRVDARLRLRGHGRSRQTAS